MRVPKKFNSQPFAYHEELILTIDNLSNMAWGVARHDGWVVFVPFALPGEVVKARIWKNEKNCSHADLLEVLTPSLDRQEPHCPLFGQCGGCQYQNISYARQLEWKTQQVGELLRLQAGLDVPVSPAIGSPQEYGYRSKITPHFKKPKEEGDQKEVPRIGFLKAGSRFDIVDVAHCPIAMDCLNEALPKIRAEVKANASQYKLGATLLLRASEGRVERNPRSVATEEVNGITYHFLAGDFFQNNPFILPLFTQYVAEKARSGGAKYLVDAYCGSGLFALALASSFEEVSGVEVSETAADWARKNAEVNGIANCQFLAASAETIFSQITYPATETTVVIDPPRKGCDKLFLDQLFAFGPKQVVYVSCNPATQIRDLAHFKDAGYKVKEVQPFDLFPQTKHLETIVLLSKED